MQYTNILGFDFSVEKGKVRVWLCKQPTERSCKFDVITKGTPTNIAAEMNASFLPFEYCDLSQVILCYGFFQPQRKKSVEKPNPPQNTPQVFLLVNLCSCAVSFNYCCCCRFSCASNCC